MKKIKNYLFFGFVLVILIALGFVLDGFFPIKPTQSAADNVSGWAWGGGDDGTNAGNGWISFNCYNDFNGDGTAEDRCGSSNYGVHVCLSDTDSNPLCAAIPAPRTGKLVGYAWMGGGRDAAGNNVPTLGWINFAPAGLYPPVGPNYSACLDIPGITTESCNGIGNWRVAGWAKVIAADGNGWDGWIKLGDGGTWPGGGSPPSANSQVYVQVQAGPDEFRGWAWGSDVVGWISFNCADRAAGFCAGTSNYKVFANINFPPTATTSNIATCVLPGWNCCTDSRHPPFSWNYSDPDGDSQASYRLQVDNDSDLSSPVLDTQIVDSGSWTYTWKSSDMIPPGTNFVWGAKYYWRVKVKDARGAWSVPEWSNISNFTLPPHAYPDVDFSRLPQNPSAKENVQFTDLSTCYDDNINGSACTKPNDNYNWNFNAGTPPNSGTVNWDWDKGDATALEIPVVSFSDQGAWSVKLEVTDSDNPNHKCDITKSFNVSLPLPKWKEIIPR